MSEDSNYRDKPDMPYIWLKHMDRTNLSAGSLEGLYDSYVRQQFRLLPMKERNWVMSQRDAFTLRKTRFVYKNTGSNRVGYENNPVIWNKDYTELGMSNEKGFEVNRLEDGEIDWSDPHIYSPRLEEYEETDYEVFNQYIMNAAESAGLSWNTEKEVVKVSTITLETSGEKTPYLGDEEDE